MAEEYFDVVNDRDEVIGRKPRSEVHRCKLNHRAVHVLVFNRRGELFLQKRSMRKDCFPGKWDSSASGHLNCDETYDACAVRELGEELSLSLAHAPARLFYVRACPETGHEFLWVYQCHAEGPFRLQADEIERGDWFQPEVISGWIDRRPEDFASGFVLIWRRLAAQPCPPGPGWRAPSERLW
jgi:isopentenyldiphosphate isomerase